MENLQHDPQIRLECLKLAHRADLLPDEVIAKARTYLAWVNGVPPSITPQGPSDSSKESKLAPTASVRTSPTKSAGKPA